MSISIARIPQETNTLVPAMMDLEMIQAFGIGHGQEVLKGSRWSEYVEGFLDVVGDEDVIDITSYSAYRMGRWPERQWRLLLGWFTEDLNKALPLDGLLLSPHGVLVGVADSGVEGVVLQRAQRIVTEDAIIGVFTNLHASITKREDKKRGYDLWVAHIPMWIAAKQLRE